MTQLVDMVKPQKPFEPSFSDFGKALGQETGIGTLMDDLGAALAGGAKVASAAESKAPLAMLGGGQPAHIPAVEALFKQRLAELFSEESSFQKVLGEYDPSEGRRDFRRRLAELLNTLYGWELTEDHIAVTAGGQTAAFLLMNALAGKGERITFPLVPEYMGYADQLVSGASFHGIPGKIVLQGEHHFEYELDCEAVQASPPCALMALSRPTNPSGNVLSNDELLFLSEECARRKIPLLIDNAYGAPFPAAIYVDSCPLWQEHHIHLYSLSKLGLPGSRTGIVVAAPSIVNAVRNMTAVCSLASSGLGQALVNPFLTPSGLPRFAQQEITPYYRAKRDGALRHVHTILAGQKYRVHAPQGAFFLWLWFPTLRVSSQELTAQLKARGALFISGHWFFFAQTQTTGDHPQQCLRMTYTMGEEEVSRGLTILSDCLHDLAKKT